MDVEKFLRYCVSKLVDNADAIVITSRITPEKTIYEVRVAAGDLARIIGKEGRTFKALRALINLTQTGTVNDLVVDTNT